jgi:hypothetical protein
MQFYYNADLNIYLKKKKKYIVILFIANKSINTHIYIQWTSFIRLTLGPDYKVTLVNRINLKGGEEKNKNLN